MTPMQMNNWIYLAGVIKMVNACCMWCTHAKQSRSACGISCGANSFIQQNGRCPAYEPISEAALAQNETADYDDEFMSMANAVKWMLRETGGKWPLLGAAIIDRLQDVAEKAEMWGETE